MHRTLQWPQMLSRPCRFALTLVVACAPLAAEVRSLTILHVNDLHARMEPLENHHGGFGYLASVIRRERANCTDCILLNAGDIAQGTPVRSEEHTSELQSLRHLVCRLLLEKKK